MKKYITLRLLLVVLFSSIVFVTISAFLLLDFATESFENTAHLQAEQLIEILDDNAKHIDELTEDLKEDFFIRARAVSYILSANPKMLNDLDAMQTMSNLLQVDEIHIFNKEGTIYAGTVADYFGLSMLDGEQIHYFLPMLEDVNLKLIQDVTPNTAESVERQYLAIWNENKEYIVQIGMNPARLTQAMQETELSYIFSRMALPIGTSIFAINSENGIISGSTNTTLVGQHISTIGVDDYKNIPTSSVKTILEGKAGLGIFKKTDSMIVGVNQTYASIYNFALSNIILVIICGAIIGVMIMFLLFRMLDKVVLSGIYELRDGMSKIASGDLDYKVSVTSLPEFETLSTKANLMVKSLVESGRKFSTIFQYVNMPLALYERRASAISVSSKMREILEIPDLIRGENVLNPTKFLELVDSIMKNPYTQEADIYVYNFNGRKKFLKIKIYSEETSDWGIIFDVTDEINEKLHIRHERDIDFLTSIYNRRAFLEQLDALSKTPEILKKSTLIMMDLDNLKYVNDSWGHLYGDAYIRKTAEVLKEFDYANKVVARLSGDEFVVLLYGVESNEELERQVKLLAEEFKSAYILNPNNEKHQLSLSAGYAFYPDHALKFRDVLQLADLTMYEVKKGSKGQFKKYTL